MTDIDPNIYASLATAYLGGMRAPSPGQEGYVAVADANGTNLTYVRKDTLIETMPFYTAAGILAGTHYRYHDKLTTTDTDQHDILTVEMPIGLCFVRVIASGYAANDGDYRAQYLQALYFVESGSVTLVGSGSVGDGDGTLTGSLTLAVLSGQTLTVRCTSSSADGSVAWTATLEIVHHA